jgi:hypothetical protein
MCRGVTIAAVLRSGSCVCLAAAMSPPLIVLLKTVILRPSRARACGGRSRKSRVCIGTDYVLKLPEAAGNRFSPLVIAANRRARFGASVNKLDGVLLRTERIFSAASRCDMV